MDSEAAIKKIVCENAHLSNKKIVALIGGKWKSDKVNEVKKAFKKNNKQVDIFIGTANSDKEYEDLLDKHPKLWSKADVKLWLESYNDFVFKEHANKFDKYNGAIFFQFSKDTLQTTCGTLDGEALFNMQKELLQQHPNEPTLLITPVYQALTAQEIDWFRHVREYGVELEWVVMDCIFEQGLCAKKPLRRKMRFFSNEKLSSDGEDILLLNKIDDISILTEPFAILPDNGIDKMVLNIKNLQVIIKIIQIKLGSSNLSYSFKEGIAKNEKAYKESINGFIERLKLRGEEISEAIKSHFGGTGYSFSTEYELFCTRKIPSDRTFFREQQVKLWDKAGMNNYIWTEKIKTFARNDGIAWVLND